MKNKTTSETAFCVDCEWENDCRNARRKAYEHHRQTGHRTNAEVVRAYHYDSSVVETPKVGKE